MKNKTVKDLTEIKYNHSELFMVASKIHYAFEYRRSEVVFVNTHISEKTIEKIQEYGVTITNAEGNGRKFAIAEWDFKLIK